MEPFGHIGNVSRVKSSNRNSSIFGHIDGVFFSKSQNLFFVEAGVGKHTDLIGNMVPVFGGPLFNNMFFELSSHIRNSTGHSFDILNKGKTSSQSWYNSGLVKTVLTILAP